MRRFERLGNVAILQFITHYSLHLLAPGLIAWIFFRPVWIKAWAIMVLTMLVDIDHVFACKHVFEEAGWAGLLHLLDCPDLYVADRCSIGFHPLHSYVAMGFYMFMLFVPWLRVIATGLLFHMVTDFQDCLWIQL